MDGADIGVEVMEDSTPSDEKVDLVDRPESTQLLKALDGDETDDIVEGDDDDDEEEEEEELELELLRNVLFRIAACSLSITCSSEST